MALSIANIQAPIQQEMQRFEQQFPELINSNVPLVNQIIAYILQQKGKQLRPMFVFLTAGLCGSVNESTHRGAALIELFHTTSLVHDDIVDEANYRRGAFSVNALWKNKIATRLGDYLSSLAMQLTLENGDFQLLKIFSTAIDEITQGELLQLGKSHSLTTNESTYYEIIYKKTASLIAACCAIGAQSAKAEASLVQQAHLFGKTVGLAYQMKDDLLDYGSEDIGKPLGNDIKERKLTLPLIYALDQASWFKKRQIIYLLKHQTESLDRVAEIIGFVRASGGLDYATSRMLEYASEASTLLMSFPESTYQRSLLYLVEYSTNRRY